MVQSSQAAENAALLLKEQSQSAIAGEEALKSRVLLLESENTALKENLSTLEEQSKLSYDQV